MGDQPSTGLKPGSHLGPYTILKHLGEGGMSVVFLAEHSSLGRLVAIKVLRQEYSGNNDAVQRFFLEARAVNQIRHPHIVDITDYSANEGGEAYYVMEFMEGNDVESLLDKRAITLLRALEIAGQAASALDAIHEAGVVHRDFKSGNVFVTTDNDDNDWVKLIDFGIAKLNDPHSRRIGDTLEGRAAGTPEFISPEQAMAKDVDHRADIYSFGVFLYQMVTGLMPFRGAVNDVLRAHVNEKPKNPRRIKGVPHRIPAALDELIMRCLAKKPEQRPQDMKEIMATLSMLKDSVRYEQSVQHRNLRRLSVAGATAAAFLVGIVATDMLYGRRPGISAVRLAEGSAHSVQKMYAHLNATSEVAAAAIVQPVAAPQPVAVAAAIPASQPASAPVIIMETPKPAIEEVAKSDPPAKKKKRRH